MMKLEFEEEGDSERKQNNDKKKNVEMAVRWSVGSNSLINLLQLQQTLFAHLASSSASPLAFSSL